MDLIKKCFKNNFLFPFVSDYVAFYMDYVNEKPVFSVLAPMTLVLLCYYTYVYVRKFYPVRVNCWFCNANFMVPFEDQREYSCVECGQFNGFKKDGSYTKIIIEQHDVRFNRKAFSVIQNDAYKSQNGLCHKCNIVQEIKIKQLASFVPSKEKNFDVEVEKFKDHLEKTLQLCYRCNQHTKKILSVQEQRYNLKSILGKSFSETQNGSNFPNECSLCLAIVVFLLSTEDFLDNSIAKLVDTSIFHNGVVGIARCIGITSLFGASCQAYQCLKTTKKLNAIVMLLWSSLFVINNFEVFNHLLPKLVVSVIIMILSAMPVLDNLTRKPKFRQSSIQLEDENYKISNYCNISANRSTKNRHKSEMMDVDSADESPNRAKNSLNSSVNNLFEGLRLNENQKSPKNNIIRGQKLFAQAKRDKTFGYAESSSGGYYSPYPAAKEDYEFDTHSVCSQQSYRSQCLPLYAAQTVLPCGAYYSHSPHHYQPSLLNASHSSSSSNVQQQQSSEWQKMLVYSVPGIVLVALQCYLLYDIKDFIKKK